ncbi:DUF4845 domain-containing protein [Legionella shakespearei]|uniref:Transmembrane protein n=1 Tax=Legionella shakespearei DSM 23087 TaxID=1122169 RepID=A0A0W0Z781_9GAMM|nr:DUF4845 domain-containing protein [Legionella shakespearei]KTD64983.1 transmembrane protein [Legionella shakespearei DSM 23087]
MHKQKGMTLIGMLLTAAVVVITAVIIMRIVPVYLQHYSIVDSIKSLSTTPELSLSGDPALDTMELRKSLDKRLDINGVEDLKPNQISIVPSGPKKYKVKLKYQVVRPLVYNMKLLFDFDELYEVTVGSEN